MLRPASLPLRTVAVGFALCASLFACSALLGIDELPVGTDATEDAAGDTNADGNTGADGSAADGSASDSGADVAIDDSGDAMAVEECGTPLTLYPFDASSGPFCPFQSGGSSYCAGGQYCCQPPADGGVFPPSACVNAGAGGANPCGASDISVQCEEEGECNGSNGGSSCCATGNAVGCNTLSSFSGTKCSATCLTTQFYVCETPAECSAYDSRTSCTASKGKGFDFGLCVIP